MISLFTQSDSFMQIKPLLLAVLISCVPIATCAKDWSKEPPFAVEKAAKQGDAKAQSYLGNMYYIGLGVEEDHKQAEHWWRQAAQQGDAGAQSKLQTMLAQVQALSFTVPGKTIELSPDEWRKMSDENSFAKNFAAKKIEPWQKIERVVTVFLNPMSEDRRLGLKISKTEYVELFSVLPELITVQVRVDKGGYWVLCRETFKPKDPMPKVTLRSRLDENDEIQLRYHYQAEIDETRHLLNSKF